MSEKRLFFAKNLPYVKQNGAKDGQDD